MDVTAVGRWKIYYCLSGVIASKLPGVSDFRVAFAEFNKPTTTFELFCNRTFLGCRSSSVLALSSLTDRLPCRVVFWSSGSTNLINRAFADVLWAFFTYVRTRLVSALFLCNVFVLNFVSLYFPIHVTVRPRYIDWKINERNDWLEAPYNKIRCIVVDYTNHIYIHV